MQHVDAALIDHQRELHRVARFHVEAACFSCLLNDALRPVEPRPSTENGQARGHESSRLAIFLIPSVPIGLNSCRALEVLGGCGGNMTEYEPDAAVHWLWTRTRTKPWRDVLKSVRRA